jgi:hypothetical protein
MEALDFDPYIFFNTPRILPPDIFHRPAVPPSTVILTGISPSVPSYNSVCMAHRLAWSPKSGRLAPVLVDHVNNNMSVRVKWDYASRIKRTEAFDEMRLGYAICSARENGRKVGRGCLKCEVMGGRCSAATAGGWGKEGRCEGCKRRGERWCLRILSEKEGNQAWDDKDATTRFLYLDVESKRRGEGGTMRVYVRDDEAHKHKAEISELARSLLPYEDKPAILGLVLNNTEADRGNMVLPDWKKAYTAEAEAQQDLHQEFVEECQTMYNLDRALIYHQTLQEQSERDSQANSPNQHDQIDHHAYFHLLHNLYSQNHSPRPRVPEVQLVLGPNHADVLRYHYWMMIVDPEYQPPREPLELLQKRVELYHTPISTEEDDLELLQLVLEAKKVTRWGGLFDGVHGGEAVWTGPYLAPWILTTRGKGLAFLMIFLVLGVWVWFENLAVLGLHVWLGARLERFRQNLHRSHISVLQDQARDKDWVRLPTGKSLHDELRDCELSQDEDREV